MSQNDWCIVLGADGVATYSADHASGWLDAGVFEGRIDSAVYERLVDLQREIGFDRMDDRYDSGWDDIGSSTLIVQDGPNRKSVTSDFYSAPAALWGLKQAVVGVAARLKWTKLGK